MIPQRHAHSKIGLLGGSFNPPHRGHREISLAALDWLGLEAVWWLVSPGNPLKDPDGYMPYAERLWRARRVADHPRIVISNFEERRRLRYTVDTLQALSDLWPQIRFVWLMGADSLSTFHLWKDWKKIATLAPIAVFNRPGHEAAADTSEAAKELALFRLEEKDGAKLPDADPPAWAFYSATANPISSTALRNSR
ncbi:MAG: nicotinate-nucleotide adenylyltransferase [Pseudomonadota bacterium]|nr:nicotinate-nucleotide adenylyltransferase [Pseudomonadota bacterium]